MKISHKQPFPWRFVSEPERDTAVSVGIIGIEEESKGPRAAYYKELLGHSVPVGLPRWQGRENIQVYDSR